MEEIFKNFGFQKEKSENIWTKGIWTVRVFGQEIEIFDDPILGGDGRYYLGDVNDLSDILDSI
jgi:hypothetical protein